MRIKRIIAFCMIFLSVFFQVSYAVGNSGQDNANSDKYRLRFSNIQYDILDAYDVAKITVNSNGDTALDVNVVNIYPGIYFNVNTIIENIGTGSVKVTNVSLNSNATGDNNSELYDMLVGLNDDNIKLKLDNYINYLQSKYVGNTISSQGTLALNLAMGMDEEETEYENTSCDFEIIINFEQVESDGGGNDDDEDDEDDDNEDSDTGNVDNDDKNVNDTENKEDKTTNENLSIETNQENNKEEAKQVSSSSESVSNSLSLLNMLPKSGEQAPKALYIVGVILMLVGIIILIKEREDSSNPL